VIFSFLKKSISVERLFDRLEVDVVGTGVGLVLVKRIIEIHDAEIWVESDVVGQGSVFCFTLPAKGEEDS
jgi:signal transduction histidine kinase